MRRVFPALFVCDETQMNQENTERAGKGDDLLQSPISIIIEDTTTENKNTKKEAMCNNVNIFTALFHHLYESLFDVINFLTTN